jgi:hypothetical protein
MENNLLNIDDWDNYIYKKKQDLINEIKKNNILDNSNSTLIFNDILKDVIKINIFNISYIAFMLLKFLETTFIPSYLILNVINVYSNGKMYDIIVKKKIEISKLNEYNKKNNKELIKIDSYKYLNSLKIIINIIIDFVVKTEVYLNINCLLMVHFIDKINNKHNKYNNNNNNDYNDYNLNNSINKPKLFNLFTRTHKQITTHIKSSTLILIFLKFIKKIDNDKFTNDILINYINDNKYNMNNSYKTYMNNKKDNNKKTNEYLDIFMIEITKYLEDTIYINTPNVYSICSNYIINNIELMFNNFENIYSILETYLLTSVTINKEKENKLFNLKTVIKNLCNLEFDNVKKLFKII